MARDFKNIKAWQLADKLTMAIYKLTKNFPKEELYGVISQLRRAAVSVPTNIAEGATRNSSKEYIQFLYIAKGSLAETEYLLHLSRNLGYLKDDEYGGLNDVRIECAKVLHGLISYVANNKDFGL